MQLLEMADNFRGYFFATHSSISDVACDRV